jgi:septum formation inhibitor-activating ATPase MinD
MGRTTTLASVALQLVRKKKNVMMIDMDIEAPGDICSK